MCMDAVQQFFFVSLLFMCKKDSTLGYNILNSFSKTTNQCSELVVLNICIAPKTVLDNA